MKHLKRLSIFVLSLIAVIVCALGIVACSNDIASNEPPVNNGGDETGGNEEQCTAHTYGDWVVTVDATCTTDGSKKRVCTKCEHEETEKITAIGHDWDSGEVTKAATCTAKGERTFTCRHNSEHTKTEEIAIDATAHSWNTGEVTKAATCTAKGETTYTCTHNSAHTKTEEIAIDATAHTWNAGEVTRVATCSLQGETTFTCIHNSAHTKTAEIAVNPKNHVNIISDVAVAATCVSGGKTAGTHCGDCNTVIVAQRDTAVDLNAHNLVKVTDDCVAPTCTEKGLDKFICTNSGCTHTSNVEIALLGHDWNQDRTCVHGHECARCNAEEPALGHSYESSIKVSRTCDDDEIMLFECSTCHDSYEQTTALAFGHEVNNSGWIRDNASGVKIEGKCEYEYTFDGVCARCEQVIHKYETVVQHEINITQQEATCQDKGAKIYDCNYCDYHDEVEYEDTAAHNWIGEGSTLECSICHLTKTVITSEGTSATVNKNQLSESGQTEVQLDNAKIAIDSTISAAIGESVEVAANEINVEELGLSDEQKAQMGNSAVYDFSLTVEKQGVDFNGGKVTVTIPYELQDGDDPENIAIWYIYNEEADGEAKVETIRATYKDGFVTFETEHFSVYTVTRLTATERCALYGHNYEITKEQTPSCTQDGYKIQVCHRCGDSQIVDYVKANGHSMESTQTDATCTTDGQIIFSCTAAGCDYSYTVKLPMTGHAWEVDEDNSIAATCTNAGYTQYVCAHDGCNETYKQTLAQKDHRYVSVETAPTCTEIGFTTHTCRSCQNSYIDSYKNATGHNYIATVVAPDCETMTDGYTKHICSVCDHRGEDTDIVKAAHTWDIEEATCGKGQTCLVCGAAGAAATEQHNMSNGVCTVCGKGCEHDYEVKVIDATCTEAGYTISTCKICGAVEKSDYVAALGHVGSTECERCHIRLIEEEFFNNALSSLFSQEFSFKVNGVHFMLEFGDMFEQYDVDFAELLISVDKDGVVTVYGFGTYSSTGSESPLEVKGEITAVLRDGNLYTKMIMPEGWVGLYQISEEIFATYSVIPIVELGEAFTSTQIQIELLSEIYAWIKNEAFPLVQNVLDVNDKQVTKVLNILADKFLDVNRITGGYVITLNPEALTELGQNLARHTIAENLDIIFGEGSFANLKAGILDIANSTLGEVVHLLEDHGLKISEAVAAVDKLLPVIAGEEATVNNLFGQMLGKSDFVLNIYISQNSDKPILDVINEFMNAPEGEEFTVDMLEEYIDRIGEINLYSLLDNFVGAGEINGKSFEEFVSEMVQSVLDNVNVKVTTNEIGIVKSLSVTLGEVAVKDLFEVSFTDFTITTDYVSTVNYNGFITEVKDLSDEIKLTRNIIDSMFPDAEKTYYEDGSIKQVIVESSEENVERDYFGDINNYREIIFSYSSTEIYNFTQNPVLTLSSDCGNWYKVGLACEIEETNEYLYIEDFYSNGTLIDSRIEISEENKNTYYRDIYFMYNTVSNKYEVLGEELSNHGGIKHNYVEDESLYKAPVGCVDEWGERYYYCNECGGSYILYFKNGHKEETKYELLNEELGCAGGVREIRYCTECNEVFYTNEIPAEYFGDHYYVEKELEGIDYSKICEEHYFRYLECVCGEEKLTDFNQGSMGYNFYELNGHRFEEWYCTECGLRAVMESYEDYDKENCIEHHTRVNTVYFNGNIVSAFNQTNSYERHSTIQVYKLVDPNKNCVEGGCYYQYECEVCGYIDKWQSEILHEHRTYQVESDIDLSQYGAVCGEKLIYWQCACGEVKNSYQIQGGNYTDRYISKYNTYTLDNGEEIQYREYEIYLYKCAVTDPQCSFTYADVRYYDIKNCREYRKLYIGCDENGENPAKIIELENYERHDISDSAVPTGNPCEYRISSTCNICHKQLEIGRLETQHQALQQTMIKVPTCTQFGEIHEWCENCGYDQYHFSQPYGHGDWIDAGEGIEYCGHCGIQNSNAANGSIVLEDYTDYSADNVDTYIIGYYIYGWSYERQDYRECGFEPYITLILSDGGAVTVEVRPYDYTAMEGHFVAFSKSEVEQWAVENGYSEFEIRLSFVPVYGEYEFDYGITFDGYSELGAVVENAKNQYLAEMQNSWNILQNENFPVFNYTEQYNDIMQRLIEASTIKEVSVIYSEFEAICNELWQQGRHEHYSQDGQWFVEGDEHYRVCDTCGEQFDRGNHWTNNGWFSDDNSHYMICDTCGERFNEDAHIDNGYIYSDDMHYKYCWVCESEYSHGSHNIVATMLGNSELHTMQCSVCEYKQGEEQHTFDGDICTVCSYNKASHEHIYSPETGRCTQCGIECQHEFTYITTETTHISVCSLCHYTYKEVEHAWGLDGDVVKCWDCDYVCQHNSREFYDDENCICNICRIYISAHEYDENGVCNFCKKCNHLHVEDCRCVECGFEIHTNNGEWKYEEYLHYHVCSQCGQPFDLNEHVYNEQGECTVCGYVNMQIAECLHEWVIDGDDGHRCQQCQLYMLHTPEYRPYEYGKVHEVYCTVCGELYLMEDHTFYKEGHEDETECELCGAKKEDEGNY